MPMSDLEARLKETIADIPDFPKEGILFRDITTVLHDHGLFRKVIDHWSERYADAELDHIASIESRGFIFGAALAHHLGVSMSLVRKPGKLPREVYRAEYELEYGTDTLELHKDAMDEGARVLVIDDLLATGGTCKAAVDLVEKCGGEVYECTFLIELADLGGREKFAEQETYSIVTYGG